ncbi:MAG: MFS transporter [Chloroflexota bacterium]|nr:MAG: hypothetical protein DIU68_10130 [Chloroflexota bacterium]
MTIISDSIGPRERNNFNHLVMESIWFGIAVVTTSQFLSVFAIRLGATPLQLGLLESIPAVVLMLSTWAGDWWRQRSSDTVQAILLPSLGRRFTFLLLIFTPFLPQPLQVPWLIFSVTLPAIPQSIVAVINPVMWREAVGDGHLTDLVSRRSIAQNVATSVSGLAFGFWLEQAAFPQSYQIMYAVAFVLVLMSLWHISRVQTALPEKVIDHPAADPHRSAVSPWRTRGFQHVAIAALISYIAHYSLRAIIPLRLVEEMGAGESFMALYSLVRLVTSVGVALLTSHLVKRFGNREMLALSIFMMAAEALILSQSQSLYLTLPAAALGGASWTIVSISLYGYLTQHTAAETRSTAAYSQTTYFAMIAGPMIGSALANAGIPLVTVLLLGAGFRFISSIVIHLLDD